MDRVFRKMHIRGSFKKGSNNFGYYVRDPREYGVVEFDENGKGFRLKKTGTSKIKLCSSRIIFL